MDCKDCEALEVKLIATEKKLNETIDMLNQLILNVNSSNKFVADLHNALADVGMIKPPKESDEPKEDEPKKADLDLSELEPEPEVMDEVN